MLLLPLICITLSASHCVGKRPESQTSSADLKNQIHLGFNAKIHLNMTQQMQMTDELFSKIKNIRKSPIYIRIPSGTGAMRFTSKDFSDGLIKSWTALQEKYSLKLIYVVNGNDSPANQQAHIQRWLDLGAEFTMFEMMNEYYLPKFLKGDTSKKEVTEKVSVEDYVNKILPPYLSKLQKFNKPFYLIAAPEKPGSRGKLMEHWNKVLSQNFSKFKYPDMGITTHLYKRADRPLDYAQIDRLRALFPEGTPIAVTEAGIIEDNINVPQKTYNHYQKIYKHLLPGDMLLDQVLYNDYRNTTTATLHPNFDGISPKGEKVLQFINEKQ